MIYIVAFIAAILILVFFHELGHFLVARWAGVRVLTFSIGFGPKLCSFKDRLGTEYQLAAIPIGGYVRMLGEDEFAEQPRSEDAAAAFCNAHPSRKVAIAAAGPFASLLLGFIIFYIVLVSGTRELDPFLGTISPDSPAHVAGLRTGEEVLQVDQVEVSSWQAINLALAERLGDSGEIAILTNRSSYSIPIHAWLSKESEPDMLSALGIAPQFRAHIAEIVDGSAAEQAGLRVGDHISQIDGSPVANWQEVVATIRANAERALLLQVDREDETVQLSLVPRLITDSEGESYGQAGIRPQIGRFVRYGPLEAIPAAFDRTVNLIVISADSIVKIVTGEVHSSNLGGPIRIAEYAGDLASLGLEPFLMLLAALTIALGLINLLPIPMLDGGHVVFGIIEGITRKPIPMKVQAIGLRVGLFIVGFIMLFALYNDISRLVSQ